jgi:hypothetical protein
MLNKLIGVSLCVTGLCAFAGSAEAQEKREFEGLRPLVGGTFGLGPTWLDTGFAGGQTYGGLLFALKGGILYDRIEAGIELSPVTQLLTFETGQEPNFQFNAYGGYHIPITGPFSWPLRGGVGMAHILGAGGATLFEARLDLIGASMHLGPVLLDVHLPSWRILTDGDVTAMAFIFGVGGAWLPG